MFFTGVERWFAAGCPSGRVFCLSPAKWAAQQAVKGEDGPPLAGLPVRLFAPGFLTFKLPDDCQLPPDFKLRAVFARAYGFSLGPVTGDDADVLARGVWTMFAQRPWHRIHVWERDAASPGEHDFEPGLTAAAAAAYEALARNCPETGKLALKGGDVCKGDSPIFAANSLTPRATPDRAAKIGREIWDSPRWRLAAAGAAGPIGVGLHRAGSGAMVGGLSSGQVGPLAMARRTDAAGLAPRCGQPGVVEDGRGPAMGAVAHPPRGPLGRNRQCAGRIEPGPFAAWLLCDRHRSGRHGPRGPGPSRFYAYSPPRAAVRRRDFRKIRWLAADMNVAPEYTLDAVQSIVTHAEVNIRGLLLTLKLPQWKFAENVPAYLDRIRRWGYNQVCARQLQHNRREFCVAALQQPFRRKRRGACVRSRR